MQQRALKLIRLALECEAGMNNGVNYWRNAVAAGDPDAFETLKRAARLPYRITSRLQESINTYTQPVIVTWLADNNLPSLAQINTKLQPLRDYSDLLVDRYKNQGWTEDQIADDIQATMEAIDLEQFAPEAGYTDTF